MVQGLKQIQEAAEGLLYRSESDYPFEMVHLKAPSISLEQELLQLSTNVKDAKVERVTLEHFFRNMVMVYPNASTEQEMMADKYQQLICLLKQDLQDISVYMVDEVLINPFIIGKLSDQLLTSIA